MAQFQNRCFSGPLTLDRYLTGGSDSGPLPHLANIVVEYTRDHLALEAKQTTRRRQGGGELVVEEEMKMHDLLNYGVERYQHTKMLGYRSVWGKTDIRHSG